MVTVRGSDLSASSNRLAFRDSAARHWGMGNLTDGRVIGIP
jgi:hypothetical protein